MGQVALDACARVNLHRRKNWGCNWARGRRERRWRSNRRSRCQLSVGVTLKCDCLAICLKRDLLYICRRYGNHLLGSGGRLSCLPAEVPRSGCRTHQDNDKQTRKADTRTTTGYRNDRRRLPLLPRHLLARATATARCGGSGSGRRTTHGSSPTLPPDRYADQ